VRYIPDIYLTILIIRGDDVMKVINTKKGDPKEAEKVIKVIRFEKSNYCVCCGNEIPEGTQICYECYEKYLSD
ncbi:MAG: hypothetical protein LUF02_06750, partial [Erysipelotrichaceae bacterium]|nr:hypothetical protein [Erysipelotrichaceae bacterium]